MFLTRIGFGSRVVVTGDLTQIDVQGGRSGLGASNASWAMSRASNSSTSVAVTSSGTGSCRTSSMPTRSPRLNRR